MTKRTADLIPWWVGPMASGHGSEFVYWTPVEDVVNARFVGEVDVDLWLAGSSFEHAHIDLGRSGLLLFKSGRITELDDGGVFYELEVSDEIARSRDLEVVCDSLFADAVAALIAISKRYGLEAPSLRQSPVPAQVRGSLADMAERYRRPLVLISPRYRHRPSLDGLRAELGDEIGDVAGWGVFGGHTGSHSALADVAAHYDFGSVAAGVDLETLTVDSRNMLLLIAAEGTPDVQRRDLAASLAHIDEHLRTTVRVIGNDNGILWLSAGLTAMVQFVKSR